MKHKYALYPMILSSCALACFLAVLVLFSGAVQPLWGRIAVLLLPALLLAAVAFFAARGKLRPSAAAILTTVLAIVLFLGSVVYVLLLTVWTATTTTTDIAYYSRAYAQIREEEGVKEVFPARIPTDAEDVSFTYYPQFLQGGEGFSLSYTTTEEKIGEWVGLLEREAQWIGSNRQWHLQNDWTFSGTDALRYQLDWDGGVNHGTMCYVLIDEETRRITFCYEHW